MTLGASIRELAMCPSRAPKPFAAFLIGFVAFVHGYGQEADTMLMKGTQSRLTLLSQIEDEHESQAFLAAYQATAPSARHDAAQAFIKNYPKSWLLAEAADIAAKASIDLGHYAEAISEARFSLRLLPENPTLLVLLANAEARSGFAEQAISDAQDALTYLDEFEGPGSMKDGEWKRVSRQLKGSAYFSIARVYATRGLGVKAADRKKDLLRAMSALDRAVAWNPVDRESFYLRGVVGLALQQSGKAASDFAFASTIPDALGGKALSALRVCYHMQPAAQSISFETYVKSLPQPEINKDLCVEVQNAPSTPAIRAGYAGPGACQKCHQREFDTWQQTGMSKMLRAYRPENIIGDFSLGTQFKDGTGEVAVRVGKDSRPYFDIRTEEGTWQRFHVDYTIGSKWQQGYATALPDGRFQVLPIEYNRLEKAWINYWKIIDPPGSPRAVINQFPRLSAATNYQQNCAICHTSQLRAAGEQASPFEHATFLQPGVDCEMCHGPSALHVKQAAAQNAAAKDPLEPPVNFRTVDHRDGVRICAQCHRQSAVREIGKNNEMNFRTDGGSFVPHARSRPYDAFSRRAFYKDGRFRETTFIVEAFTRSACYRKGTAQCATCHAPHLPNFETNQTSLKFKDKPNQMCLSCHAEYRDRISEHTHHAATAEASQCVSCHMPRIMNALLFQARSHQIEIPRADLTQRFGQAESPNACLLCHSEKDTGWVEQQLQRWRG
ncbi:MAG TPA: cytochrome c3 family protein [Bryobacteraceae bacterium]|nr:cytochrome c3 family protein [Bryobacteraceae bacterium]